MIILIFGNQDALPDMANRAWSQSLANADINTLVVATALLRLSTAKYLTPVAILPRRPGRLEGDALGKESWWNEAACNPDASHHKTAFSLIFGEVI